MRIRIIQAIACLSGLLFGGCMNHPEFVDARDVRLLEKRVIGAGTERVLYLRGFVFHSALAVQEVLIDRQKGVPWVQIRLTPAGPGLSGRFEVRVPIPEPIDRVLLGAEKAVIWNAGD